MRTPRWFRDGSNRPSVPTGIHLAAAWSWRFIAIIAALAVAVLLIIQLSFLVIPLLIAVLLSVLAAPVAQWLRRLRVPGWLATLLTIVGLLSAVTGLIWLVVEQIRRDWTSLQERSVVAYEDFIAYLLESPLHLTEVQLNDWLEQLAEQLNLNSAWILSGALSISSSVGSVLVGAGLALFALVFFVHDGERILRWLILLAVRLATTPFSKPSVALT